MQEELQNVEKLSIINKWDTKMLLKNSNKTL